MRLTRLAHQHDAVFLFGVRTAGGERNGAAQHLVVKGRRALQGHDVRPPVHHALILAEKAMAADIHAVALIAHRLGDAADLVTLFQNRYVIAVLEQLVRRRQSGGAGSDNPYFLHFVAPVALWRNAYAEWRIFAVPVIQQYISVDWVLQSLFSSRSAPKLASGS